MARVMAIIQAEAAQAKEAAAKAKEAREAKKAKEAQKAKEAKEEAIQKAKEAQEAAMARETVFADILRYLANENNFAQEEMRGFATLLLSQEWADDMDDLCRGERLVVEMIFQMMGIIDRDEPIFLEMRSREGQLYWRIKEHADILRHLANDKAQGQLPGTQDPLVSGARGCSLALGSTFQGEGKEPKFGSIPTPPPNDDPKGGKNDAVDEAVEVPKAPTKKAPAQVPCGEGRHRLARGRSARLRGLAWSGPLIDHSKQRG